MRIRDWLLPLLLIASAQAQTRRAVVVGIDRYHSLKAASHTVRRIPVKGRPTRTVWTDLAGAVNDAREMKALLIGRLGFKERDIVFLTDEQATADAILTALKIATGRQSRAGRCRAFLLRRAWISDCEQAHQ